MNDPTAPSSPWPLPGAPSSTTPATTPDQPPVPEPASSTSLRRGQIVTHTFTDPQTDVEHTNYGIVVDVLEPYTDEKDGSEAPERARVAWLSGVSGPIPAADLETV